MLLQLLFFTIYSYTSADKGAVQKCYSCSSAMLHSRWPKDEETNRLQFLNDFPWYANESCDSVRSAIPVVDCPGSVCIKAVIKEPPAKRDVCVESGAVVRDCWSRVMKDSGILDPAARNNLLRLTEYDNTDHTIGYIYTCKGLLCNISYKLPATYFYIVYFLNFVYFFDIIF